MEGTLAIVVHLCQIKGTVLVPELTELFSKGLNQEQPWFCWVPLPVQQTASISGHRRWEEEKRTNLFSEINGVTPGVNGLFTNISSSVFHLARETALPSALPIVLSPQFVSDSQGRAPL